MQYYSLFTVGRKELNIPKESDMFVQHCLGHIPVTTNSIKAVISVYKEND